LAWRAGPGPAAQAPAGPPRALYVRDYERVSPQLGGAVGDPAERRLDHQNLVMRVHHSVGERGPASTLARLVLACAESSYVTGVDIVVDGGMKVW